MRVLCPVVQPLVLSVFNSRHHVRFRGAVARQLVGDHDPWCPRLPLQQLPEYPLGSLLIAPSLHQHVKHHPGLVDGAPKPMRHAVDLEDDLIQVPLVTGPGQPAPDLIGESLAELAASLPQCFLTNHDAAESQHVLDHPQAEREAEVRPHRLADDLSREAIPAEAGAGGGGYLSQLPGVGDSSKLAAGQSKDAPKGARPPLEMKTPHQNRSSVKGAQSMPARPVFINSAVTRATTGASV